MHMIAPDTECLPISCLASRSVRKSERGSFLSLRVLALALTAASAFSMVSATAAHAFSLFGLTLFEDEAEAAANAVIADPREYDVIVNVTGDESLIDAIRDASALWEGRDAPASGAAGLLSTARSEYRRIQSALFNAGYYGGTISILANGREAAQLPPDAMLEDPIDVTINVTTGPTFHFGRTEIINAAPTNDGAYGADIGFTPGQVAAAGTVRQAALLAVEDWRQRGHAKAEVSERAVTADHRTDRLDAVLTVTPGQQAVIGTISVVGASAVDADFIIRQTGLVPGKVYDPDDLVRAREQLAALDVFNSIKIEEADTIGPDGSLPLTIHVQERKPRRVGAGATFSTIDGLGVETFFLHRNLFGEGERLRLVAKLAGIAYPIDTDEFDYYFGGSFTKPGIITPVTDLHVDLTAQRTVLTRYTETSINARLALSHEFTPQISGEAGIEVERSNFYDTLYGTRDFALYGVYGGLTYDTRNDATDPSRGVYANLTAEPFYETQFGNAGLVLEGEARGYLGLGDDDRFVLAGRVKAGLLYGPSTAETPPNKLFFAGGGGSVRGYSYRSIGVDGPGGTVTGGRFLTEASVEARMKISDTWGAVGFIDAGYVTDDSFVGLGEGTRIGAGLGLRYFTGFGPLRLDFAVPLNKRAGDPDYAIYAGIGQSF